MGSLARNDRQGQTGQFRGPRGKLGDTILQAAQREFLAHGYKGTSIESIARAARIAKGTVYLYFDTKEDVFRAVSKAFIDWFLLHARTAAATPGAVEDRLYAVLDAKFGAIHALASRSEHGRELVDSSHGVSGDLYQKADRAYVEVLAGLLAELELSIPPTDAGWLVFRAAEGTERAEVSTAEVRKRLRQLARVLVKGLQR
jgi:AcrR family transcriptional regulator